MKKSLWIPTWVACGVGTALLLLTLACTPAPSDAQCTSDSQCSTGLICEANSCICRTDDACGNGQYCNAWGACQNRPPCLGNQDCGEFEICNSADPTGGKCIPSSQCGSSVHCDINYYCDPSYGNCQPGCRTTGDCQLGHICTNGQCEDGMVADDCTQCPTSPEPDSSYCDYGEICNTRGQCVPHAQANALCQLCSSRDMFNRCPASMLCLLDDAVQNAEYCAPFCRSDLDCPNGYGSCNGLQIAANGQCRSDSDCGGARQCLGSSEGVVSTCSCLNNNDCPQTGAQCVMGQCANIGNPCSSNADCVVQCKMIERGDGNMVGICETKARACGKGEGFTCDDLADDPADCTNY